MSTQTLQKWHADKIGNLGKVITGKTPPTAHKEFFGGEFPFITPSDIDTFDVRYLSETERTVTELWAFNNKKYILPRNAITYVCIGSTVGKIGLTERESITNQQINSLVADPNKLVSKYGYYLLRNITPEIQQIASARGAGKGIINKTQFEDFNVTLPNIDDQQSISDVLSTYDDLIENNTRRIKILEQIAQVIYTEWFVDFRFPGHEKVKMIDSGTDFGKIPEGWSVGKVGNIADFLNGYAFKPKDLGDVGFPVVKIPELRSGILIKTPRNTGDKIPKKYLINTGDILFSWSATLLVNIWNSGEALLNQHLFKVTPKKNHFYSFAYFVLLNQIEKYRSHAVGATMQHLRRDVVVSANILLPSQELLVSFEEIVSTILKEKATLSIENNNLRQTRDLLLPKLVTGEIKI